jgi:hypothetical protein
LFLHCLNYNNFFSETDNGCDRGKDAVAELGLTDFSAQALVDGGFAEVGAGDFEAVAVVEVFGVLLDRADVVVGTCAALGAPNCDEADELFDGGEGEGVGSIAGCIFKVGPGVAAAMIGGEPGDLGCGGLLVVGKVEGDGWGVMAVEADAGGVEVVGGGGGEESGVTIVKVVDGQLWDGHELLR